VVVSSASNTSFTGGLDTEKASKAFQDAKAVQDVARTTFLMRNAILDSQLAFTAPERCHVPVICALHGKCVGLAMDLALACDIRLVHENATMTIKEVDIAIAADVGTLARGPKAVGSSSLFFEHAFTAIPLNAKGAVDLGFASHVVDKDFCGHYLKYLPDGLSEKFAEIPSEGGSDDTARIEVLTEALDLATLIASKSPIAVASTKRLLLHARDNTTSSSLEFTQIWNAAMLQAKDVDAALTEFNNKKTKPEGQTDSDKMPNNLIFGRLYPFKDPKVENPLLELKGVKKNRVGEKSASA